MSGSFSYDDSRWPLLLIRLEGAVSDQQYEEFFAHGLFDVSRVQLPTSEQRQQLARWMKEHD